MGSYLPRRSAKLPSLFDPVQGRELANRTQSSISAGAEASEETLRQWLTWSDAYDQINARMLKEGEDLSHLEAMFDQIEQLRQQAVVRTRALLRTPKNRRLA